VRTCPGAWCTSRESWLECDRAHHSSEPSAWIFGERLANYKPFVDRGASGQAALPVAHDRDRRGGLGWIDVHLLASATLAQLPFWTVDRRLASAAHEFGVGLGN
jgi:hypothetical protein